MAAAVEQLVTQQLGPVQRPSLHLMLEAAIADGHPAAPIVLLTSGREDPAAGLRYLATQHGTHLTALALGRGQEQAVDAELQQAASAGSWLLVQVAAVTCSRIQTQLVTSSVD
jgi:Dynein heavy chain region D6 P-loop domain